MRITQQPGYVLHLRSWRETSLILECLTHDHGRIGIIARGARRERSRLSRAVLEPFQPLLLDFSGTGELHTLNAVECRGGAWTMGHAELLAGLYINELTVRMVAREDSHPQLMAVYERAMHALAEGAHTAWTLRCFERDLLREIGYGLELAVDADSRKPLNPELDYVYVAEHGPVRWQGQSGVRVRGADLLAFADNRMPDDAAMMALRRVLYGLVRLQLGGAELRSSRVLGPAMRAASAAP